MRDQAIQKILKQIKLVSVIRNVLNFNFVQPALKIYARWNFFMLVQNSKFREHDN